MKYDHHVLLYYFRATCHALGGYWHEADYAKFIGRYDARQN